MFEQSIHLKMISDNSCSVSWDIPRQISKFIECYFGRTFSSLLIALRLNDVTSIQFNGSNAHLVHEIILTGEQSQWTFKGLKKNRSYNVEVGVKLTENYFFPMLRSNIVVSGGLEYRGLMDPISKSKFEIISPNWANSVSTYTYYLTGNESRNHPFIFEYKMDEHDENDKADRLNSNIFSSLEGRIRKSREKNTNNKILLLTWEFPPYIVGGLSRHVQGLAKSLQKKGYEVHVISSNPHQLLQKEHFQGVHVYRVNPLHEQDHDFLSWIGGLNLAMLNKALELDAIHHFSLIHAHDWLVGACGSVLQEILHIPLVVTIHATEYGRNNGIYTEFQKFIHKKEQQLIKNADVIIVCSEYMEKELYKVFSNIHGKKIQIIQNGISEMKPQEVDHKYLLDLPIQKNRRFIFSIGRIVNEKGFDILIEAANKMKRRFPDVYFIIAGKGPLLHYYQKLVRELNLQNNVFFIGFVTDEQRIALLSKCALAVFPSRYEPFGIVALEAMQAGKPTIVSNTGGLKDIVQHKKTGLLMSPGSSDSFIEQAAFLLENDFESEKIGRCGKERVDRLFNWDKVADDTIKIYEEVQQKCFFE